jgi:hypothetical protein
MGRFQYMPSNDLPHPVKAALAQPFGREEIKMDLWNKSCAVALRDPKAKNSIFERLLGRNYVGRPA